MRIKIFGCKVFREYSQLETENSILKANIIRLQDFPEQ